MGTPSATGTFCYRNGMDAARERYPSGGGRGRPGFRGRVTRSVAGSVHGARTPITSHFTQFGPLVPVALVVRPGPGASVRLALGPRGSGSRSRRMRAVPVVTAVSEGDLVQTFLPFPSFDASAEVLDARRLGKQRVEAVQVLRGLVVPGYGWRRHPAVRMWVGYEEALVRYGLEICGAWTAQGHADTCAVTLVEDFGAWRPGAPPHGRRSNWPPTGTCRRGWARRTSTEAISPRWCARPRPSTGIASRGYRTTCRTSGPGPTGRRTGCGERRAGQGYASA